MGESATYTHGHDDAVLRSHRWRTAENSAPHLLPLLRAGQSVLDVGCGPGTITVDLARRVAPGRVLAIDPADTAVAATRTAAAAGGVVLEVEQIGVHEVAARGTRFDVVHAHQVLQHLSDPVAALGAMRSLCTADGVVAVRDADYAAFTWFPEESAIGRWLEVYEAVARANGGEPDAGRRLLSWAQAAGFEEVTASSTSWCFATHEDRRWWASLWAERTTSTVLATRAVELGLATVDELAEIAVGWRRWAEAPDGWFLVPHGEVICRG